MTKKMNTSLAAVFLIVGSMTSFGQGAASKPSLAYAEKITSQGYVLTNEAFREFVTAGPDAAITSSTSSELAKNPRNRPPYLVLRFNHPEKQHLSGEVAVSLLPPNGKPMIFHIDIHIGNYWRDYFIPLDSWGWRPSGEPVGVKIEWLQIKLE